MDSNMKQQLRTFMKKTIFALCFVAATAEAETRPEATNPLSWIAQLGPIAFSQSGGAFLPLNVLQAMQQGNVSPIMQFVMGNSLMTQCVREVEKKYPDRRDPYVVAAQKFQAGICRLQKCFQTVTLISLLPALQGAPATGDTSGGQTSGGSNEMAMTLMNSFKQQEGCDGSGDSGIDPAILMLFAGR